MICTEYEALLDLYVDGELTTEELLRVQTHLDQCPHCRAYVDDAMAMRLAFPEIEETELPEGFHESVMARIAAESAPVAKKSSRNRWWKTLAPVAAACFAVMLLANRGGLLGRTEESAAAQAPAAASYAMDFTTAEEGECAPAAEAPAEAPAASAPASDGSSYEHSFTAKSEHKPVERVAGTEALTDQEPSDSGEYAAVLTIPAEAAAEIDFLGSMERMELADGSGGYLLSWEDYETLLSLLPETQPAEDLPAGQPVLVRIQD